MTDRAVRRGPERGRAAAAARRAVARLRAPFPPRCGNRFRLLVDSPAFLPEMERAIETARERVLMEQYIVRSGVVADRFIERLVAAARRGVRVCLHLDHFGSRELSASDRLRLAAAGVELLFFNPAPLSAGLRRLYRTHRKILVVDDRIAFTGGFCVSDDYAFGPGQPPPWLDVAVAIEGPVVADWRALFLATWRGEEPEVADAPPPVDEPGRMGQVTTARPRAYKSLKRSFFRRARHAERRLWFATAYFQPSRKVLRALRRAASRGVDVRLLLPGPLHNDHPAVRFAGQRHYLRLLRHGVRIFEYRPRFLHVKAMLADDWSSVGSCNMDRWNLHWNLEANQEVFDAGFAAEVADLFEAGFADSREVELETWEARPRLQRMREWFWGWVDLWLERLSRIRGRPRP